MRAHGITRATHVIVYLNSLGFENVNFLVLSPFQITDGLTLRLYERLITVLTVHV